MPAENFPDYATYAARPLPFGYPEKEHVTLFAPEDNLHGALAFFVNQAQHSLAIAIYGFDDDALATAILRKLQDEHVYVQLCLDSSQAAGKHEAALLKAVNFPRNVVAFGRSEAGAIMHLKCGSADGIDSFDGSTNWSTSGESKQDNSLTFTRHPMVAFQVRHKIDTVYASMLRQAQAKEGKS
jgi:phosphatidylserine/phosphatidylglycerophosphate/cardiolipin synthase-like enzyme